MHRRWLARDLGFNRESDVSDRESMLRVMMATKAKAREMRKDKLNGRMNPKPDLEIEVKPDGAPGSALDAGETGEMPPEGTLAEEDSESPMEENAEDPNGEKAKMALEKIRALIASV